MGIPHFLHLQETKQGRNQITFHWITQDVSPTLCIRECHLAMPQRCEGPDSWAWKCPGQSACSLHDQSPAPPASSVAPPPCELPSSSSPQPYRRRAVHTLKTLKRNRALHLGWILTFLLFGLLISPYFGISLGTLQFSLSIRKLVPFSINLSGGGKDPLKICTCTTQVSVHRLQKA